MKTFQLTVQLVLLFGLPWTPSLGQPSATQEEHASIRIEDLRERLAVLASPEFEGRETATEGQHEAGRYIASVFESLKLKLAGDSGTFFQRFDVDIRGLDPTSLVDVTSGDTSFALSFGRDFLASTATTTTLSGPVVFIGYLNTEIDSAEASKLEGAFVLAFAGRRSDADLSPASRARRRYRREFPGALGIIMIFDHPEGKSFESITSHMQRSLVKGSMTLSGSKPSARYGRAPVVFVSTSSAARFLHATGTDILEWRTRARSQQQFSPVQVPATALRVSLTIRTTRATTENVLGLLEGADPELNDEVVVMTAHYDHLGKTPSGDIYYGADDDGSGTSMLLELADAFTGKSVRPDRSILFLALTGEEKGLLGSAHYAAHPVIPLENTIANLNIDMIGRVDEKHATLGTNHYVYVIGSDKISTELDSLLQAANRATVKLDLDYTYNDDQDPNQFYRRSDHYNFARHGVPVVFFFTGIHEDYHRTTDTVDKIQFDKMVPIGQLVFQMGWELAHLSRPLAKTRVAAP
jgi:hypothetical protein